MPKTGKNQKHVRTAQKCLETQTTRWQQKNNEEEEEAADEEEIPVAHGPDPDPDGSSNSGSLGSSGSLSSKSSNGKDDDKDDDNNGDNNDHSHDDDDKGFDDDDKDVDDGSNQDANGNPGNQPGFAWLENGLDHSVAFHNKLTFCLNQAQGQAMVDNSTTTPLLLQASLAN